MQYQGIWLKDSKRFSSVGHSPAFGPLTGFRKWTLAAIAAVTFSLTTNASAANIDPPKTHRADFWGGEWPNGFTLKQDTSVNIRSEMDINAARNLPCTLKKGATYHPWNQDRVKSDDLKFVTHQTTNTLKLSKDYEAILEEVGEQSTVTLSFVKGETWTYLTYYGEGLFEFHYKGKRFVGDQELYEASKEVDKNAPSFLHQWLNLTCANGTRGWLLYNDIVEQPGFEDANKPKYGVAIDLPAK